MRSHPRPTVTVLLQEHQPHWRPWWDFRTGGPPAWRSRQGGFGAQSSQSLEERCGLWKGLTPQSSGTTSTSILACATMSSPSFINVWYVCIPLPGPSWSFGNLFEISFAMIMRTKTRLLAFTFPHQPSRFTRASLCWNLQEKWHTQKNTQQSFARACAVKMHMDISQEPSVWKCAQQKCRARIPRQSFCASQSRCTWKFHILCRSLQATCRMRIPGHWSCSHLQPRYRHGSGHYSMDRTMLYINWAAPKMAQSRCGRVFSILFLDRSWSCVNMCRVSSGHVPVKIVVAASKFRTKECPNEFFRQRHKPSQILYLQNRNHSHGLNHSWSPWRALHTPHHTIPYHMDYHGFTRGLGNVKLASGLAATTAKRTISSSKHIPTKFALPGVWTSTRPWHGACSQSFGQRTNGLEDTAAGCFPSSVAARMIQRFLGCACRWRAVAWHRVWVNAPKTTERFEVNIMKKVVSNKMPWNDLTLGCFRITFIIAWCHNG